MHDADLLRDYSRNGSEAAFTELVKRYVNLVYATARRQVGDPHLAEEITQSVFCLLARKAGALTGQPTLAGWLYRAACFKAARAVRTEQRRRRREKEAAEMSQRDLKDDEVWESLSPVLDEGLNQLREKDRLAVLLRFFQRKPMREVGEALGISEAAAKMRVGRAVEQLRHYFGQRGLACSSAALTVLLAEKTAQAAPETMAATVSKAVLSGSIASSVSTSSLIRILTLMTKTKATILTCAVIVALALLIAGLHFSRPATGINGAERSTVSRATPRDSGANAATGDRAAAGRKAIPAQSPEQMRLEQAKEALHAALHQRTKHEAPAYDEIKQALDKFGDNRKAAFDLLVKEIQDASQHEDPPRTPWNSDRGVRSGALWAIGQIGPSVPEAASFLWDTVHSSTGSDWDKTPALAGLYAIGFTPKDLPDLTELLSGPQCVFAGRWISELLQRDPTGTAPFAPAIEKLLDAPDQNTRSFSALALLQSRGTQDPRIIEEIQKLFAGPGDPQDRVYRVYAVGVLKDVGPAAKPLIPDLLSYAGSVTDVGSATYAYAAIAAIDPGMAQLVPQVARALEEQSSGEQWAQKWKSGSYTDDDLLAALKLPSQALTAAAHLGEKGSSAQNAVPQMLAALEGKDEDTRDAILEAIHKIDPQVVVSKVSADTFLAGVAYANGVFASRPKTHLDELLDSLMTRDQLE